MRFYSRKHQALLVRELRGRPGQIGRERLPRWDLSEVGAALLTEKVNSNQQG